MADGDFVVVNAFGEVVRIDRDTGDRTLVSGVATGSGPLLGPPEGIAVEEDGQLVVVSFLGAVIRINPATGIHTLVSGCSERSCRGGGPELAFLQGIAVEADGQLVVVSFSTGIIRIDPVTGDRTLVSGCIERHCRGSGPDLSAPTGIVVVVSTFGAVVRVNPDTGVRTSVSGSGPPLHSPEGIAVEENGQLVAVDSALQAIVRIDRDTGVRAPVSGCAERHCTAPMGNGPLLSTPTGIAVEANGQLVVVDSALQAIVRVEPLTGTRAIISR
jgi:streptogramin lyase